MYKARKHNYKILSRHFKLPSHTSESNFSPKKRLIAKLSSVIRYKIDNEIELQISRQRHSIFFNNNSISQKLMTPVSKLI